MIANRLQDPAAARVRRTLLDAVSRSRTARGSVGRGLALRAPGPGWRNGRRRRLKPAGPSRDVEVRLLFRAHMNEAPVAVDLYWIPLGAGAHVVRISGRVFEALSAWAQRRARRDLYHSALTVSAPEGEFVIEQTPVLDAHGSQRGVVAEGPVGLRSLGRFRVFRYEIRRWRDGTIPDVLDAVASPVRISNDATVARQILAALPSIPTPVWGRDELDAGEMWNSNSVIAWVLARAGVDLATVRPPAGGRAPGWDAGRVVAAERAGA